MFNYRSGRPVKAFGVTFRSELEFEVARFFRQWNQRFIYEPKIKTSDNKFLDYQVDFLLPDARLFVEVKPKAFTDELTKMRPMINHHDFCDFNFCAVAWGNPTGLLRVWDKPRDFMFMDRANCYWDANEDIGLELPGGALVPNEMFWGQCKECQSFIPCGGNEWGCFGCGWYGGDSCMIDGLSFNTEQFIPRSGWKQLR
jgi:hypothetical protein